MIFNSFLALWGQLHQFFNRAVSLIALAALGILLTACVSGGGGGGGGQPPPARGLFSHASYDFVLLNTTRTGGGADVGTLDSRTLGLIYLEDAEVRARLPAGITTYNEPKYRIVPARDDPNDLTLAFFQLKQNSPTARLVFEVAERYNRRVYNLDYVVNTLGVDELRVEANISYVDQAGVNQTLAFVTVPVRIRAVASVPSVNAFLTFEGRARTRSEQRVEPGPPATRNYRGALAATLNASVSRAVPAFTTTWNQANYAPDRREPTPVNPLNSTLLLRAGNTTGAFEVAVTITLNNAARIAPATYRIPANTAVATIDGDVNRADSWRAFLRGRNQTTAGEAVTIIAADGNLGPNVATVAWRFDFPYTRVVPTERTRTVTVSSRAYTAAGNIDENVVGRAGVRDLTNILSALAIRPQRPAGYDRLPTFYLRVRNANHSSPYRCQDVFYLDHQGFGIKAQGGPRVDASALDHEAEDAYICQLEASLRGFNDADYGTIVTTNLTDSSNQTDQVTGMAAANSTNALACGSANATTRLQALRTFPGCTYRAGLAIAVNDLNEPVVLALTARNNTLFEADVGAVTALAAVGEPLVLDGDLVLANVSYHEPDEDVNGTRLGAALPTIHARAVPVRQLNGARPPANIDVNQLFFVTRAGANLAHVMLNASAAAGLDYEALGANATGQRGYRLTLRATDNSTASLITDQAFNLEIKDVIYAPVDFTYAALVANGMDGSAEGPLPEQHLLPGFAQFVANGGPVLGRLSARDPEANTSASISYQYLGITPLDPADPVSLSRNTSFVLSQDPARARADELLLVGLGLRDGARFNVTLRAAHDAAPRVAVADLAVATTVSYAAANVSALYMGAPPVQFARGVFTGSVVEGRVNAGAQRNATTNEVIDKPFLVGPDAGPASFALMTNAEITQLLGGLGAMRADAQRALAGRLAALSGPEQFTLNATTGVLMLRAAADFTAQPVYTLLLRVTNTTGRDYARSDYAVLRVVVVDNNTAPRLVNLRALGNLAMIGAAPAVVTLRLPEDTRAGTPIATWEVEDDNPLTDLAFAPASGATAYTIERAGPAARVTVDGAVVYRAPYRLLAARPDHEANATLDLTHIFNDGGQYAYALARGQAAAMGGGHQSVSLKVNGTITDINEAPRLAFWAPAVDARIDEVPLVEDAAVGTIALRVRAEDPEGMTANLTYTLTTEPASLAAAFNASAVVAVFTNEGRAATWPLRVADAAALENAGDGQIFTLVLTATEPGRGGLSIREEIAVEVVDVVQPFNTSGAHTDNINITEQQALDAVGRDLVLRDPLVRLAEVQPDYDEFFFGTDVRFGDVAVRPGALTYATAGVAAGLEDEQQFNLLTLRRTGLRTRPAADDGVALLLGEEELIEPNLLGEQVILAVELTDPAGGVADAVFTAPVDILPTRPAGLAFGSANATGPRVPAAYNFAYQQSPYVAQLGEGACAAESGADNITIAGQCYPTVWVEDAAGRASYVARDASAQEHFGPDRATRRAAANQEIGIIFTDVPGANITLSEDVLIYGLDGEGNLQDARAAFETYFTLTVNNSYARDGAARPALALRHRSYAVLNRTSGAPLANQTYAALDTVPLAGLARERTLSYFLVAVDGVDNANNASHRAIAQVNVAVTAVGNAPAEVRELRLADTYDLSADTATRIAENGLPELVNNPMLALNITVANPDAVDTNQSVDVVVDVVATETSARSDGIFVLMTGRATGNELVRLGPTATSNFTFTLGSGMNRSAQRIPFQLARNAHGTAFIRVTLRESDRNDAPVRDGLQTLHYEVVVSPVEPPAIRVVNLTVADQISGQAREDGFGTATPELRFLLNSTAFAPPWAQRLAAVTTTSRQAFDILTPRGAVQFAEGATAEIKEARQELNYAEHTHGETVFDLSVMTTEGRGFDERAINVTRALAPAFNILSVNDALRALSDVPPEAVDFRLERDFNNVSAMSSALAGTAAAVFFADVDLATGDPLPLATQIRILPGAAQTLSGDTTIQLIDDVNLRHGPPVARRVAGNQVLGAQTRIRVEIPAINLTLTQAQYNAINARTEAITLNFTVNARDSGAPSLRVNATGQVTILLATFDANVTAGNYTGGAAQLNEGTAPGTPVFATNLTLGDEDLRRPNGDIYTYTLAVTRAGQPVSDLLRWNRGAETAGSWRDVVSGQSSAMRDLAVVLARRPEDVDVDDYQVTWTIHEQRGADVDNRRVDAGAFTLTIVNVEEAPVVYCDARNVTDDPSCGYVEGMVNLQEIFGAHDAPRLTAFQDTGVSATVVLRDPDLLALDDAALPAPAQLSIVNATLAHLNRTDGPASQDRFELGDGISIARDAANADRFTVTAPLHLNLTRSSYDFINQNAGGVLRFELNVTHALGSTLARARLVFSAAVNNPIVNPSDAYTTAVAWPEGTAAGTSLSPESSQINITDPDVTRANGDNYTYTLMVMNATNAPVTDLLAWRDGTSETVEQATQQFNRTLEFAKELDDADVGVYTVTWSIADALNTRASDAPATVGSLTLNITNIPDPITPSSMASRAALYLLGPDFNPGGERRRTPLRRNATAFFTDGDLLALGDDALPAQAQVVALPMHLDLVNVSGFLRDPRVRRVGRSQEIAVVVPVDFNLTDAQFTALGSRGESTTFQLNITVTDADAAAASAWAVTEIIIDTDNDATVVANQYDGGEVPDPDYSQDNLYWERIDAGTAVFLGLNPATLSGLPFVETNITITDRDINTTAGDTYTYGLSVRRTNNRTAIGDFLVWSHGANETLKEQADITFNRTTRFARDLTEADIGMYTVSWNITDERTALRAPGTAAANGTFTMNIQQTPIVTIGRIELGRSGFNNELIIEEGMDPVSLPDGSDFFALLDSRHGDITFALDYNRSLLGNFVTLTPSSIPWERGEARLRRSTGSAAVGLAFAPTDQQVGEHFVWLLATTAGGTARSERITINVTNVDDPTTAAAGTLTGNSRGPRAQLPLFNLSDEDFEIPGRAAAIAANGGISLTSGLNLTFQRAGSAQSCVLPTQERFFEGTLNNDQFRVTRQLSFNLLETPCAAILNAAVDRSDELLLTEARLFDYIDPSGGTEQATDDLLIASGQLNMTLDDIDEDGLYEIRTAADLDAVRADLNANYELEADIDLVDYANWQPLGNSSSRYTGVFDGNGYTIANLSTSGYRYAGLFGVIAGTILANLTLRVKHIRAAGNNTHAGSLAGTADHTNIIRNVHVIVAEDISANHSGGDITTAGGLIGLTLLSDRNSLALGISNSSVFIGGNLSIFDNDVGSRDAFYAGGLIGAISLDRISPSDPPALEIDDSYARVNGSIVFHSQGGSGDTADIGGLVGRTLRGYRISNVYAFSSNITTRGFGGRVGGFMALGHPNLGSREFVNSYFTAPVSNADNFGRDNSLHKRSLRQLECPIASNRTCEGATTYTDWANTIWDFGDDQTLPDLRARPDPLSDLLP